MSEKRKIKVDGEEFEVDIMMKDNNWEVSINGKKFKVESEAMIKPKKRRKMSTRKEQMGSGIVSSAIPGKVVSILVSEGEEVKQGEVVLILEAMKMQNEIKAPLGGVIRKVSCTTGHRVEANVPLLEIESVRVDNV